MQIVISNKTLESRLIEKSKKLKIKVDDLIEKLLRDKLKEESEFKFTKKDPLINIKKLKFEDSEDNLTNPFEKVENVVEYAKELRETSQNYKVTEVTS